MKDWLAAASGWFKFSPLVHLPPLAWRLVRIFLATSLGASADHLLKSEASLWKMFKDVGWKETSAVSLSVVCTCSLVPLGSMHFYKLFNFFASFADLSESSHLPKYFPLLIYIAFKRIIPSMLMSFSKSNRFKENNKAILPNQEVHKGEEKCQS